MKAIITFTSGLESSASEKTMSLSVRLGHDGDKGGTPVLEPGTTTTLDAGINATAEIVLKGVDTEGNPKYKVNFGIPKGAKGDMPTPVQAVSSSTTDVPSCKAVADAKELLFRDMWNSGCGSYGKFNTATGYYELNGLTNITYTQALRIYNIWERKLTEGCYLYENIRTNMPVWNGGYASIGYGSCYLSFAYNTVLEKAMVSPALYYINSITNASLMFNNCQNLDEIIGNLICPSFPSTFSKCYKLRKLYVKSLKSDISFSDSPLLNYDSVKYMVDNAANTTAIVITVHATTLGYLNGTASDYTSTGHTKEEWQAIVTSATTKNITFATA